MVRIGQEGTKAQRKQRIRSSTPIRHLFKFSIQKNRPVTSKRDRSNDGISATSPEWHRDDAAIVCCQLRNGSKWEFVDQPYDNDVPISYQLQTGKLCGSSKVNVTTVHSASEPWQLVTLDFLPDTGLCRDISIADQLFPRAQLSKVPCDLI